jgi:hypothetical protein
VRPACEVLKPVAHQPGDSADHARTFADRRPSTFPRIDGRGGAGAIRVREDVKMRERQAIEHGATSREVSSDSPGNPTMMSDPIEAAGIVVRIRVTSSV